MTRIIFVRHGESVGNLERRFYGNFDKGLTDLGRQQADKAGEYILENYKLDTAYASDLDRAYETGEIIAKKQGLTPIPDKGLREIYAGLWENRLFDELMTEFDDTYTGYNEIQKNQGLDLEPFKGVRVKQWCYEIKNYPGYENKKGLIQGTILVYDGVVVGGDICSLELDGFMHGFSK